jgi:DNA-binding XRE family transcriptional regulator
MFVQFAEHASRDPAALVRRERRAFAAKLRMARAVIGCSQSELALHVGLTQRSVHKLEQGETEPRRATVYAIEYFWREHGIEFEDQIDGGFRVSVRSTLLDVSAKEPECQQDESGLRLGAASMGEPSPACRA